MWHWFLYAVYAGIEGIVLKFGLQKPYQGKVYRDQRQHGLLLCDPKFTGLLLRNLTKDTIMGTSSN